MRTGFGYDVHRFAEGRELWLGGVKIPHTVGLLGHSDADVLIHALCDALLGAAALGDIGTHFPDTAAEFKNIDSKILLRQTMKKLQEAGYDFVNADCTVVAEEPKLAPYIAQMQQTLEQTMGVEGRSVSVKATTSEQMGFTGRKEGIAAYAVALIDTKS